MTLPAGKRQVAVTFDGSYPKAPYVMATPRDFIANSSFRVTKVKPTGFVVEIQQAQPKDIRFDWHADWHASGKTDGR